MANRVVLIPFRKESSLQDVLSIIGEKRTYKEDVVKEAGANLKRCIDAISRRGHIPLSNDLKANHDTKEMGQLLEDTENVLSLAKKTIREKKEDGTFFQGWNPKKFKHKDVVFADSDPEILKATLRQLQAQEDTLYISGHCRAGSSILESTDNKEKAKVEDVIRILDGKLKKHFPGKIKIFACESAKDTIFFYSFAKSFATLLWTRGWVHCQVFGYTENVLLRVNSNGNKVTDTGKRAKDARKLVQPLKYATCPELFGDLCGL